LGLITWLIRQLLPCQTQQIDIGRVAHKAPENLLRPLTLSVQLASSFFLDELAHIEVVIETALGQEGIVSAALDEPAVVDDQHLIGLADGAQAVSDDEGGAAGHQP
jgi:hypothetical protein